jgi:hypothetical protein
MWNGDERRRANISCISGWVWAEEAIWYHSSVQVMGSRTGEFPDPSAYRAW